MAQHRQLEHIANQVDDKRRDDIAAQKADQKAEDRERNVDDRLAQQRGHRGRARRGVDRVDERRLKLLGELRAGHDLRQRALRHLRHGEQGEIQILDAAARVGVIHQRIDQRVVALEPRRQRRADGEGRRRRADERRHAEHPADKAAVQAEDQADPQHRQNQNVDDVHGSSSLRSAARRRRFPSRRRPPRGCRSSCPARPSR